MKRSWNFCANTGNQKTGEQNPFYLQTTFPFPSQPHTFPRILSWNMSITGPSPKVHTMVPMPISPPKKKRQDHAHRIQGHLGGSQPHPPFMESHHQVIGGIGGEYADDIAGHCKCNRRRACRHNKQGSCQPCTLYRRQNCLPHIRKYSQKKGRNKCLQSRISLSDKSSQKHHQKGGGINGKGCIDMEPFCQGKVQGVVAAGAQVGVDGQHHAHGHDSHADGIKRQIAGPFSGCHEFPLSQIHDSSCLITTFSRLLRAACPLKFLSVISRHSSAYKAWLKSFFSSPSNFTWQFRRITWSALRI